MEVIKKWLTDRRKAQKFHQSELVHEGADLNKNSITILLIFSSCEYVLLLFTCLQVFLLVFIFFSTCLPSAFKRIQLVARGPLLARQSTQTGPSVGPKYLYLYYLNEL